LFEKAEKVVFLNSSKYYYLQRDDSIIGAKTVRGEADKCIMMYERYIDLINKYPGKKELLLSGFYLAFADFGYAVARCRNDYFRTYKDHFGEIIDFAAKNKKEVWKCRFIGRACKLNYMLFLRETRLAFIGIRFFVFIAKIRSIFSSKRKIYKKAYL
ncbi:MAG: hypothetical protein ABFD76_06340, partial [Smithella sp.]